MRGVITEQIQEFAKEFLGREISRTELKLYPYIDYCIKNGGRFEPIKINDKEREVLRELKDAGFLYTESWCFYVTEEFYRYLQTILWFSYVETKIEKEEN